MRYKTYKEVDLPWVKEVPEHWKIKRNKNIFKPHTEIVGEKSKETTLLSLTTNGIKINSLDKLKGKIPETYDTYQLVEPSDLILCLFDLDVSAVFSDVSDYSGMISPAYDRFKIKKDVPRYYKYIFDKIFQDRSYKIYSKSVRFTVTSDNFLSLDMINPPKEEQEQIARFLDWKINEIDRLILYKKENIAKNKKIWDIYLKKTLLKENETIKLKYISHVIPGKEIKEEVEYRENAVPVYGSSDTPFKYTTESLIDGKYIIFGRKGTIGKPYRLDGKFWIIDTAYAVKNNDLVEFDFLYYLFNVINWSKFTTQTALPSIVANEVMQEKVYFPSKKTQKDISEKLKDIEGKIENANIIIKKQIEKLKLLKESLISDVVTGKIDVRNVEILDYEEVKIEEIEELEEEVSYGN